MDIIGITKDMSNRQLNLKKVLELDDRQRSLIMSLFEQLIGSFSPANFNGIDSVKISVIYNTLVDNDYLVTRREKNLDNILKNEDI